jgi:hypothetical protein
MARHGDEGRALVRELPRDGFIPSLRRQQVLPASLSLILALAFALAAAASRATAERLVERLAERLAERRLEVPRGRVRPVYHARGRGGPKASAAPVEMECVECLVAPVPAQPLIEARAHAQSDDHVGFKELFVGEREEWARMGCAARRPSIEIGSMVAAWPALGHEGLRPAVAQRRLDLREWG